MANVGHCPDAQSIVAQYENLVIGQVFLGGYPSFVHDADPLILRGTRQAILGREARPSSPGGNRLSKSNRWKPSASLTDSDTAIGEDLRFAFADCRSTALAARRRVSVRCRHDDAVEAVVRAGVIVLARSL